MEYQVFLFYLLIEVLIYVGLRYRKIWVVNLILIFSSFEIVNFILYLNAPVADLSAIITKMVVYPAKLFFYVYQIYFLS